MLERAAGYAAAEPGLLAQPGLTDRQRGRQLNAMRRHHGREIGRHGRFRLPPRGFSIGGTIELFALTGDIPEPGGHIPSRCGWPAPGGQRWAYLGERRLCA